VLKNQFIVTLEDGDYRPEGNRPPHGSQDNLLMFSPLFMIALDALI
jgi:hypothetical protein